jgi:cytochrome b involved in lipid metabolism
MQSGCESSDVDNVTLPHNNSHSHSHSRSHSHTHSRSHSSTAAMLRLHVTVNVGGRLFATRVRTLLGLSINYIAQKNEFMFHSSPQCNAAAMINSSLLSRLLVHELSQRQDLVVAIRDIVANGLPTDLHEDAKTTPESTVVAGHDAVDSNHSNAGDDNGDNSSTIALMIDRDGTHFRYVLNFLRDGSCILPPDRILIKELLREARFFELQYMVQYLEKLANRVERVSPLVKSAYIAEHNPHPPALALATNETRGIGGEESPSLGAIANSDACAACLSAASANGFDIEDLHSLVRSHSHPVSVKTGRALRQYSATTDQLETHRRFKHGSSSNHTHQHEDTDPVHDVATCPFKQCFCRALMQPTTDKLNSSTTAFQSTATATAAASVSVPKCPSPFVTEPHLNLSEKKHSTTPLTVEATASTAAASPVVSITSDANCASTQNGHGFSALTQPLLLDEKQQQQRRQRAKQNRERLRLNADPSSNELSWAEIAKHNTANDCWLVVKDVVYDVTPFIALHPAGEKAIVRHGGTDATVDFDFHSSKAKKLWSAYKIGIVEGTKSSCVVQ